MAAAEQPLCVGHVSKLAAKLPNLEAFVFDLQFDVLAHLHQTSRSSPDQSRLTMAEVNPAAVYWHD